MPPTTFRSRRTTWTLHLYAAHLVAEGPSLPLVSTSTVPQAVSYLVVVVEILRTLNEIEQGGYSQRLIAAELLLQLECSGKRRGTARKTRRVAPRDRKYEFRTP